MLRRPLNWTIALLGALALSLPPVQASAADDQLPNLVTLSPFGLRAGREAGEPVLRFSVGIANRGGWALDLLGVPHGRDSATALQCVRWAAPFVCTDRTDVGSFVWHPEHGHFHYDDFALYELRRLGPDDQPDMSPDAVVSSSGKVSFCLLDYEPDGPGPLAYSLGNPVYYACELGNQGISPGWRDVYVYSLPGQHVPLADVADGRYGLVVTVDPDANLHQTSRSDDVAWTPVRIAGGRPVEPL